jgi:hypothetical protein
VRRAALLLTAHAAGSGAAARGQPPIPLKAPPPPARSQAPDSPPPPRPLDPDEVRALERQLRELLLKNLPDPVVESAPGWGHQKAVVVGSKFHKDGWKLWTEQVKAPRNDGTWRRVSARAANPAQTLTLSLRDVVSPEPGRVTFAADVGLNCDLKFEQQVWKGGARLYSGETRARCRAALALKLESTNRLETAPGAFLPDAVFRMRVTDASLTYTDLVVEHTAGVGGSVAKVLGDAVIATVKQVKPQLERDLLAKANAAVVKAGDTKEVRVSLGKLLGSPPASKK